MCVKFTLKINERVGVYSYPSLELQLDRLEKEPTAIHKPVFQIFVSQNRSESLGLKGGKKKNLPTTSPRSLCKMKWRWEDKTSQDRAEAMSTDVAAVNGRCLENPMDGGAC